MDAVERQVRAYNAHDVEEFVSSYADDVVVEDAAGGVFVRGSAQLYDRYTQLFAASPSVRAEIATRIRVGRYVVDEEFVHDSPRGDIHAVAVYRLNGDGLIDRVVFFTDQ